MESKSSPIYRLNEIVECSSLSSLSEPELGLLAIHWFVLETNNGGLHQFFYNDSGQLALPALSYLQHIGAHMTADILRRAIALFPRSSVPTDWGERQGLMISMEDCGISFDALTNELFLCKEDVDALHRFYAREHPDMFSRVH